MSGNDQPFISAETETDSRLVIKAGGEWSIHKRIPSFDAATHRLEQLSKGGSLRLDFSAVKGWDSSLVSFVAQVVKQSQGKGIRVESEGLPEGIQRLLKTALAVPERNIRPSPEKEFFFARLGKAGIVLGAGVWEVFSFLGLSAMAFGRFLRGRAVFRWGDTWLIIQRCGAEALPIVTLINFLVGMILGFVSGVQL